MEYSYQSWALHGGLAYGTDVNTSTVNCWSSMGLANTAASTETVNEQYYRADLVGAGFSSGSCSIVFAHVVNNSVGVSSGSVYGFRSRLDNTAGTMTAGTGYESKLGSNLADQTVTAFTGFAASAPSNAGTLSAYTGLSVGDPAGTVTAAYGVSSAVSAGAGRYNVYAGGTAVNYLAGAVRCGADTDFGVKVGSSDGFAATVQGSSPAGVASTGTMWFAGTDLKFRVGTGTVMTVTAS